MGISNPAPSDLLDKYMSKDKESTVLIPIQEANLLALSKLTGDDKITVMKKALALYRWFYLNGDSLSLVGGTEDQSSQSMKLSFMTFKSGE